MPARSEDRVAVLIHIKPQTRDAIKIFAENSGRSVTSTVTHFVEKVFGRDEKEKTS